MMWGNEYLRIYSIYNLFYSPDLSWRSLILKTEVIVIITTFPRKVRLMFGVNHRLINVNDFFECVLRQPRVVSSKLATTPDQKL
jgi:hypothetical protein